MAFSSNKGPWSSIIQERRAYRPDYLGACCQPVWLSKGCVGRNACSHVQMWFSLQASFFRTWLQWAPVGRHQRKAAECGLQRASCFVHVSDVCNNDQVFMTIFYLPPLPLCLIVFSSPHGFPLAAAQVVTNSNIFTERKRNGREGPQELHGWNENDRP